jgi:hypothetical protein
VLPYIYISVNGRSNHWTFERRVLERLLPSIHWIDTRERFKIVRPVNRLLLEGVEYEVTREAPFTFEPVGGGQPHTGYTRDSLSPYIEWTCKVDLELPPIKFDAVSPDLQALVRQSPGAQLRAGIRAG